MNGGWREAEVGILEIGCHFEHASGIAPLFSLANEIWRLNLIHECVGVLSLYQFAQAKNC